MKGQITSTLTETAMRVAKRKHVKNHKLTKKIKHIIEKRTFYNKEMKNICIQQNKNVG